jgi:Zinc-finger domain of monoamine-oxidase A repressor R1
VKKFKTITGESIAVSSGPERQSVICHQCRQHVHIPLTVQCTMLNATGSSKKPGQKQCSNVYCQRCLGNRYNERMSSILAHSEVYEEHVQGAGYNWSCPACRKICNCSMCRKKMGLTPLGYTYTT